MATIFASRISFLYESVTQLKSLMDCLDNNKCDGDKKLENVRKEKIAEKMKLFDEIRKLHPDDLVKRQKEITKVQNKFLNNVKNWDNIKPYTKCVKDHCKDQLIHFLKIHVPFFENQIKINTGLLKNKYTTPENKIIIERYLKKDRDNLKRIKNINKWKDTQFNEQLYKFASVTYPKFLFII